MSLLEIFTLFGIQLNKKKQQDPIKTVKTLKKNSSNIKTLVRF